MGLEMVSRVRRYQGQCRALRPPGHQGYRLRSYQKDSPLHSGYTGEAPHPRGPGNPCNLCREIVGEDDAPLRGHDLGCSSAKTLHWFCSRCIAHLHACLLCRRAHPLCTAPPSRETQTNDLTLHSLRGLIAQNVWAPPDAEGGNSPDVTWLDVLGEEDPVAPPHRPPWCAPTWTLPAGEEDPTIWVPDYQHYGGVPRGSLPPVGSLPESCGPFGPMNRDI